LGWPSLTEGLANISSRELSEWMAFDAVEPIGDSRLDLLFAYLMAVTVNLHKSKDDQAAKVEDFLLDFWAGEEGEASQSLDEQRRIIEAMKRVFERSSQ
jgi:hypothetical protein